MKRLGTALIAIGLGIVGSAAPASASSVIYTATTTNLTNMTHQNAYAWQLEGINLGANTIQSAVLTFNGFYNWTTAANDPYNILWVDLLDTARSTTNGAILSATDDTNTGTLGINDVLDAFRYTGGTNISVAGTSGTALYTPTTQHVYMGSSKNTADANVQGYDSTMVGNNAGAFGTTPVTWSLTVTNSTVLAALASYITNGGDIALGLDSDCHFGDTSITFQIYGNPNGGGGGQSAVPEPASMLLLGTGLATIAARRRKKNRNA